MCIWSDITAVLDYEIHYMNAWLKRCVFNLGLNRERECVWHPNIIRKAIPEFGSQIWKIATSINGLCHSRYFQESNQIKSNHFYCHITIAQVLWWVKFLRACSRQCKTTKQQFTYGQYIFTECTEDNVQNTHTYTQYTQCTIKTYFVTNAPIHIIHRIYMSGLCPHLCIVICEGVTDYNLQ